MSRESENLKRSLNRILTKSGEFEQDSKKKKTDLVLLHKPRASNRKRRADDVLHAASYDSKRFDDKLRKEDYIIPFVNKFEIDKIEAKVDSTAETPKYSERQVAAIRRMYEKEMMQCENAHAKQLEMMIEHFAAQTNVQPSEFSYIS